MKLDEIINLKTKDFSGGDRILKQYKLVPKEEILANAMPLPEHQGLKYYINGNRIFIVADEYDYPIAMMELTREDFPLPRAFAVMQVTVSEKFRGIGLAQAMYKIVLSPKPAGMGGTLMAGDSQTPGGKKNWVRLSNIPNIEILGWIGIDKKIDSSDIDEEYFDKLLDDMFGKIGVQPLGQTKYYDFYSFPLTVNKTKLENLVKRTLINVYNDFESGNVITGMFAKYAG